MPAVDHQALLAEDEAEAAAAAISGTPVAPRYAYGHDVHYDLSNSGRWESLPSGGRIWRLRLVTPGSSSIMLVYDRWRLPKGAELYLYSDDRADTRGAFTHENNWLDGTNLTAPTRGDAVIIELVIPHWQPDDGELSISRIGHGYRATHDLGRALDGFGDAEACHVNVNCPQGANWQDEKRGIAMIISSGFRTCSGSLIRSACDPRDPLFLTAAHCGNGNESNWVFVFNYESAGCANPPAEPSLAQSVANATLLASWPFNPGGDFMLLRLSALPPPAYGVYMNGWDRRDIPDVSSVGIHHPSGDIKKLVGDAEPYLSDFWTVPSFPHTHWTIEWDYGAVHDGSSGSPLFNSQSRIVGDLTGGYVGCENPELPIAKYGKLAVNWTGGGTQNTRLKDWLDPCHTNLEVLDGTYPPPAVSDDCGDATYIGRGFGVFPYVHASTTSGATNDYTSTCQNFLGPDVVYRWDAGCCSTSVTATLCGTAAWDTGLYVRRDSCNGEPVVCNDDFCGLQSRVSFTAEPERVYYLFVDGFTAISTGPYSLTVTGAPIGSAPLNDHCAGALAIGSLPYSHTGSTCAATNSVANCGAPTSAETFYTLTLPTCESVTVSTCGTPCFDTSIEIRTGGTCPGATRVACMDDGCGLQTLATFVAQPNQTYYILVHGFRAERGDYTLNVTGTPFYAANDECTGAIPVTLIPFTVTGDTRCGSVTRPGCGGFSSSDLFYSLTSVTCGRYTASLCGSTYDTRLELRAGGSCPGDVLIGCSDDEICGQTFSLQSEISWDLADGIPYYMIVSGYNLPDAGPFTLTVTSTALVAPANDVCGGATDIPALPYDYIGSTSCAQDHISNPCYGGAGARDVVFRYQHGSDLPCDNVLVSLCGSTYDTGLRVTTGGACPGTTEVGCSDDARCNGTLTSTSVVVFAATPGQVYWFHVDGYTLGANGAYRIAVQTTCEPESLVVQRLPASNDIRLAWRPPHGADAGLLSYRVYRSTTYPVDAIPANLIATVVSGTQFVDAARVGDAALQSYYAVTGDVTSALRADADAKATALTSRKRISATQAALMHPPFVPAYLDSANLQPVGIADK